LFVFGLGAALPRLMLLVKDGAKHCSFYEFGSENLLSFEKLVEKATGDYNIFWNSYQTSPEVSKLSFD